MPVYQPAYHSRLYRDFKEIHPDAHRDIIRFYDENEKAIRQLDFAEAFELLVAYVDALFDAGRYRRHLTMVDSVIETTIQLNIFEYQQKDLFRNMLINKGLSLLHIHEFGKAEYIFRELLRIDVHQPDVIGYLEKSIRLAGSPILHVAQAVAIGIFFLSAIVIGMEILIVRPFYESVTPYFEWGRNGLFVLGIIVLIAGRWWHGIQTRRAVKKFIRELPVHTS